MALTPKELIARMPEDLQQKVAEKKAEIHAQRRSHMDIDALMTTFPPERQAKIRANAEALNRSREASWEKESRSGRGISSPSEFTDEFFPPETAEIVHLVARRILEKIEAREASPEEKHTGRVDVDLNELINDILPPELVAKVYALAERINEEREKEARACGDVLEEDSKEGGS